MGEEFLTFEDIEIEKKKDKTPIFLGDAGIEKVLTSKL